MKSGGFQLVEVLKKVPGKAYLAAAAAVVVIVIIVLVVTLPSHPASVGGALVCLDPGHGGTDSGAKENGVAEKDVNLDIALRARALLQSAGYRVIMTRESDTTVSLWKRCSIANSSHASVMVSIHNNAKPPDVQGTTTYYCRGSSQGALLAICVQGEVVGRDGRPDRGIRASRLYMVRNATMPAALLEGVFLTSKDEAELIQDAGFRQKIAAGVAAGVTDFLH